MRYFEQHWVCDRCKQAHVDQLSRLEPSNVTSNLPSGWIYINEKHLCNQCANNLNDWMRNGS